jgi:hypothetical protein
MIAPLDSADHVRALLAMIEAFLVSRRGAAVAQQGHGRSVAD